MRPTLVSLQASKIREVANAGMGRSDVLPFWFGEGNAVTPAFIREAAKRALDGGETFYTHNLGITPLREALSAYLTRLHGPIGPERVAVTSAGISGLMLVGQALLEPGARIVIVTPVWPNLTQIPEILSAQVTRVPLECRAGAWSLDLDRLIDAIRPGTAAVMINSPSNPTGWAMTRTQQEAVLAHCRKLGVWIVSDDAYERLHYLPGQPVAPSFFDIATPEDRLISANTFSKSWSMTGWRLGWIVAPAALVNEMGKLIEYNTSCAPGFVQRAGITAIEEGDALIEETRERYRACRDYLVGALAALPGVEVAPPPGAMYAFFRVRGVDDSLAFAKRLVLEAGLGLAPGAAFGPEGEGFLRWCFAASEDRLREGVARLARVLG